MDENKFLENILMLNLAFPQFYEMGYSLKSIKFLPELGLESVSFLPIFQNEILTYLKI